MGRQPTCNRYRLILCLTHANEYALDFRDLADAVDRFYLAAGKTSRDLLLIKHEGTPR